ncbi:MAG: UPF0175 family protein [Acidobacteriota bacterium]|nr:UPF0175 family protein [Acidobacteriota bacterium]
MDLTVHIPDELVAHLGGEAVHGQLERRALEAFALEEYKADRISKVQLRKMLKQERIELDGFLKSHGVYEEYTMEDFEAERHALQELGL